MFDQTKKVFYHISDIYIKKSISWSNPTATSFFFVQIDHLLCGKCERKNQNQLTFRHTTPGAQAFIVCNYTKQIANFK